MFNRVDNYFIITTNNPKALEAITVWIYMYLKKTYCIGVELFSNKTVYRIYVPMSEKRDKKVREQILEDLEARGITIMEES